MTYAASIVMGMLQRNDLVRIVPIKKCPNAERVFVVDDILDNGFLYGVSETCNGYVIPFNWVEDISIIGKRYYTDKGAVIKKR